MKTDDEIEQEEQAGELKLWHWCLIGFVVVLALYLLMAVLLNDSSSPAHNESEYKQRQRDASNYFALAAMWQAERDRAFKLGYVTGEIDMNERIWKLVDSTN